VKGITEGQAKNAEEKLRKFFKTYGLSYSKNILEFRARLSPTN